MSGCVCRACDTIADCKAAFGKYWEEKSGGGVGCTCKFAGWGGRDGKQATKEAAKKVRMPWQEEML